MNILLLERIVSLEPGRSARAERHFSGEEDFFEGHFPGFPVVPGSILLECMVQTAGWLLSATGNFGFLPLPVLVETLKFRDYIRPGDILETRAEILRLDSRYGRCRTEARRQGKRVAEAKLAFHLVELAGIISTEQKRELQRWQRDLYKELRADFQSS